MTRLVAVRVLADQAGDVRLLAPRRPAVGGKQRVEAASERSGAAHESHEPVDVMRHEEAVLPRVGFGVMVVDLRRIERRRPEPFDARAHQLVGRIEQVLPRLRPTPIAQVVLLPSEAPGHLRDGPVVERVLQRPRHAFRFVAGIDEPGAFVRGEAEAILFRAVCHRLECEADVDAVDTLRDRVGDHRDGVVADHGVGLVGRQFPDGQAAAILVLTQHRPDEVARAAGIDQREERVQRPERVPQGEDRVIGESLGPVDPEVTPAVLPVDVHVDVGRQHGVVQRRVERHALRARAPFDPDLRELAVPRGIGRLPDGVEVPSGDLRFEVAPGAVDADGGNADLYQQRTAVVAEGISTTGAVPLRGANGPGETDDEVHDLIARPGTRSAQTGHFGRTHLFDGVLEDPVAVVEVDDDVRRSTGRKRVPVHRHARRRGQLDANAVIAQRHRVVTGPRGLLVVAEGGRVSRTAVRAVLQLRLTRHRHQQDVRVVGDAGAAQVCVRKPEDAAVAVVIAGTAVPSRQPCVGTRLDHAERQRWSRIGVSVSAGADKRVHQVGQLRLLLRRHRRGQQPVPQQCRGNPSAHRRTEYTRRAVRRRCVWDLAVGSWASGVGLGVSGI